jgi:mono/diheme cytochrome c family protein
VRNNVRFLIATTALCVTAGLSAPVGAQTPDGGAIFNRECATCHTGAPDTRAPAPDVLRRRSPEAILSALTAGGMRPQG